MRYIKGIFLSLFVGIFLILGLNAQGSNQRDVELLVEAFKNTNAEVDNYWLHIGIPYLPYENDTQLLKIGNQLSESLMLGTVNSLIIHGKQKLYSNSGTWGKDNNVELIIKRENEQSKKTYLVFKLKGNGNIDNLLKHYLTLENILNDNQLSPKINTCIQGNINDKLNNVDQFVLMNKILGELNAKEVESLHSDLVKSISAYSPKFNYSILSGDNKMNIQVATHVNNINKKTVLTLGTPIITIEY